MSTDESRFLLVLENLVSFAIKVADLGSTIKFGCVKMFRSRHVGKLNFGVTVKSAFLSSKGDLDRLFSD